MNVGEVAYDMTSLGKSMAAFSLRRRFPKYCALCFLLSLLLGLDGVEAAYESHCNYKVNKILDVASREFRRERVLIERRWFFGIFTARFHAHNILSKNSNDVIKLSEKTKCKLDELKSIIYSNKLKPKNEYDNGKFIVIYYLSKNKSKNLIISFNKELDELNRAILSMSK